MDTVILDFEELLFPRSTTLVSHCKAQHSVMVWKPGWTYNDFSDFSRVTLDQDSLLNGIMVRGNTERVRVIAGVCCAVRDGFNCPL